MRRPDREHADALFRKEISRKICTSGCGRTKLGNGSKWYGGNGIAIAKTKEPTYIRLAREKTPIMTTEETPFEIGKAQVFYSPLTQVQVGIIATGALVHKAIVAAKNFGDRGIAVKVLNVATIKPIDSEAIINFAKESGAIVTVEEHQIIGGLGSAVAEVLAQNHPVPIEFIGVRDKFGQSGTPAELIEKYEMGVGHIEVAIEKVLSRK